MSVWGDPILIGGTGEGYVKVTILEVVPNPEVAELEIVEVEVES